MTESVDVEDLDAPDLRDYGRALWRHRRIVVFTMIVAVGAAVALSATQTPTYEATTDVIIQPNSTFDIINQSQGPADASARAVATETAILQSKVVQDAAANLLGHAADVTISSNSATSDVVSITARASKGKTAADDANGYSKAYVVFSRQRTMDQLESAAQRIQGSLAALENRIPTLAKASEALASALRQRTLFQSQLDTVQVQVSTGVNALGGAKVLSAAMAPKKPVSPKPIRNAAIALILGLFLGIGLAFLREFLDDKIATREDLERATNGLPVLGQITRVDDWRKATNRLVTVDPSPSEESTSEAYRTLRTSIQFLGIGQSLRTIQITSAESGEGKTVTVANIAVAFARAGRQVAVVCCDLRRPRVHELFGLQNKVGFTSVLLGEMQPIDALQLVAGEPNLAVLSAGPAAPNPSELLGSSKAWEVISALAEHADIVLVDSPPVLPVSDALIVSGMSDATILVASVGTSTRRSIRRSLELLRQVDAPIVGAVLNNAEPVSAAGYAAYAVSPNGTNGSRSSTRNPVNTKRAPRSQPSSR